MYVCSLFEFEFFLNSSTTNQFRNINDGLQPWFSDRPRFGLRALKSQNLLETEEGLAAINTLLQANYKMLFFPALTYCEYTCIIMFVMVYRMKVVKMLSPYFNQYETWMYHGC